MTATNFIMFGSTSSNWPYQIYGMVTCGYSVRNCSKETGHVTLTGSLNKKHISDRRYVTFSLRHMGTFKAYNKSGMAVVVYTVQINGNLLSKLEVATWFLSCSDFSYRGWLSFPFTTKLYLDIIVFNTHMRADKVLCWQCEYISEVIYCVCVQR